MKAIVKAMWVDSATINLDNYFPEDSENFGLWIEFRVGPPELNSADDFRLLVCTPEWLKTNGVQEKSLWGRHMLIVLEYDISAIKAAIDQCVDSCTGKDFGEIAQKISRFAAWEFEDH